MKQVIEIIKQAIAECERDGDMFHMPTLNRNDVSVTKNELEPKMAFSLHTSLFHLPSYYIIHHP